MTEIKIAQKEHLSDAQRSNQKIMLPEKCMLVEIFLDGKSHAQVF